MVYFCVRAKSGLTDGSVCPTLLPKDLAERVGQVLPLVNRFVNRVSASGFGMAPNLAVADLANAPYLIHLQRRGAPGGLSP
jgi:hypothetical protein